MQSGYNYPSLTARKTAPGFDNYFDHIGNYRRLSGKLHKGDALAFVSSRPYNQTGKDIFQRLNRCNAKIQQNI
jgi:hypothetical protein